jgi:predicted ATPase
MQRFILTRAPGAGKTAVIRQLELDGFGVVEEAATDIIALEHARGVAEPWKYPSFIDSIVELQRRRQLRASHDPEEVQFHDRSAVCTAALAVFLGYPFSEALSGELQRIETEAIYQKQVFFIQNLGFITATEARRINFEEARRFEQVHQETYSGFGFEIVLVKAATRTRAMRSIRSARVAASIGTAPHSFGIIRSRS